MKSKPQTPESAIFENARWIWPVNHHWDITNSYALFRKIVDLKVLPARAPFFITADQSYRLFVNGRFVARGPARGYQVRWPYDEIDLRPFLKKGRNLLAVRAHNPGRSTFQYITQGFAGLLVALRWGKTRIVSDPSWKSLRQDSASRDTVPASMQLFSQEHVDLRKERGNWMDLEFDDSGWVAPADRPWDAPPWFSLEARGIPMPSEKEIEPMALIGEGAGNSAAGYENVRDVVALRYLEDRSHRAVQGTFRPLTVPPTKPGKFRSYLLDFGKTVVGNLTLAIEGAAGGEILDSHYIETIGVATLTPDQIIPSHCRPAFGERLICRAGDIQYSCYHHYGFRYLALTVRDAPQGLRLIPRLNWTGYPLDRKGSFTSSDRTLEQIWEICAWTEQCCSLDAYVDTPWREQAQWWGDARVQAWNTFHLAGDARLFRRGISQIAGQVTPDGVTYGHAPTMAHECVLPDFTLIWFLTLWDYYWQTGSLEPLLTHHQTVQNALEYFRKYTDSKSGLVTYDDRYWLFLDWTGIFKDGTPTVYNLWLLIALDKMALLYRKARRAGEAFKLEAWARKLRVSLGRLVSRQGLIFDGIDRQGKVVRQTCIHAQTLALAAQLQGMDEERVMQKILLPFIRGESEPAVTPSAYWITYVFSVLQERGFGAEVVAFIKKRWLPMIVHGTTWENFDPRRGSDSFSHAWSAHPLYHLMQTIGGITQLAPAWGRVRYRPEFIGDRNETVIPTPQGPVVGRWQKTPSVIEVELLLPAGVLGRVELPGTKTHAWVKSGKWQIGRQDAEN